MKVNAEKTKAMKFRIQKKTIGFVRSSKYLGIVLRPALGFGDQVEQLVNRTAKTIACLGNLQRVSLAMSARISDLEITPMIRYGMASISKRLSKTATQNLERCRS